MVGRLVLGLLWLTCVHSETLNNMPMEESSMVHKMPMTMSSIDDSTGVMAKAKRYLSHQHSSPCPPFYPHFGMHMPMYAMRPYGPPAYPKNDIHMPMYHEHHHHQPVQYIHQPSYTSYVPKQTVQYVKQHIQTPMYHHPVQSPSIHHVQPNYYHYHQPMVHPKVSYEKQPVFAYAPAYHKPMSTIWKAPEIKPAIVYKPEAPKCAPCPPAHQPPAYHHPPQPSISYIKLAQPIHQVAHSPSKIYLPAHQPLIKPCDK